MTDEFWNFICFDCRWKGVAQELGQDETLEEYWHCPQCKSVNIEQTQWYKGDKKYTGENR